MISTFIAVLCGAAIVGVIAYLVIFGRPKSRLSKMFRRERDPDAK